MSCNRISSRQNDINDKSSTLVVGFGVVVVVVVGSGVVVVVVLTVPWRSLHQPCCSLNALLNRKKKKLVERGTSR